MFKYENKNEFFKKKRCISDLFYFTVISPEMCYSMTSPSLGGERGREATRRAE